MGADGVEIMTATIKVQIEVTSGREDGHNPMIPVRDALAQHCVARPLDCGKGQKALILFAEEVEVRR